MNKKDKEYVKNVIDHFIEFYKFDLRPYNKAYKIWFETGLHAEIIVDFLKRVNIPANVRLIKRSTGTVEQPNRTGYIERPEPPIHFLSPKFKQFRFNIVIDPEMYNSFEFFITTLIHELAHLVLYSSWNKYKDSEVATDLFVMCFGLYTEKRYMGRSTKLKVKLEESAEGYITHEQKDFAHRYILLKRAVTESKGIKKIVNKIKLQLLS
jgi:hypothetical protein